MKKFPSRRFAFLPLTLCFLATVSALLGQTYQWTTVAGGIGGPGASDGATYPARFNYPWDVAVDGSGTIYVADFLNHTIRKVSPAGVVSTFAGSAGQPGNTDGVGGSARLTTPRGVAVDTSGNVYVAQSSSNTIRKITSAGVVTTLAGSSSSGGSADGTGSAARFNSPSSVAVDASGNVYVADTTNHTIRKITPAGVVSTLAGSAGNSGSTDGTGTGARFSSPYGVAVDSAGNVYVADSQNSTLRKVTSAGVVTTLAGLAGNRGSVDGTGNGARFFALAEVAVDAAGNVYVVDYQTVRKVTSAGVVTTLAGSGSGAIGSADGPGTTARFYSPEGLAVDSSGNVYVADLNNHTIRKMSASNVVSTLAGTVGVLGSDDGPQSTAKFFNPRGTAADGLGNVYVADRGSHTIRKVSAQGTGTTLAGTAGMSGTANGNGAAARFNAPQGVAAAADGTVYVADSSNHAIRKITPSGAVTTVAGLAGTLGGIDGTGTGARFNNPQGVALGGDGNLYVVDTFNNTLRKITPAGVVTTLAGYQGSSAFIDGTGSAARFGSPNSVTVDGSGNFYVGDSTMLRKVTPAGVVTTVAGTANSGTTDGIGTAARFYSIQGVAADSAGVVYVADSGNEKIRRVGTDAAVTSLAGGAFPPFTDGIGTGANFSQPSGICLDASGNLQVAEQGNHTLRRVTLAGVVTTTAGAPRAIGKGSSDGMTVSARFNYPVGMVEVANGTVYVADYFNGCIRAISPEGRVTVWAGKPGPIDTSADGTGAAAVFTYPTGVAMDSSGNAYVAQSRAVRKVTPSGVVTTLAGSFFFPGSTDGTGGNARFGESPAAIALDSAGNLYVADTSNHTIRKITSAGVVTTLAGLAGSSGTTDATGNAARFNSPYGVAVDTAGNVYVGDTGNHTIRKIAPGGVVTTLAGGAALSGNVDGTGTAARFNAPYGLTIAASGNLFVVDRNNYLIRQVTPAGVVTTVASSEPAVVGGGVFTADGTGVFPFAIAAGAGGKLYVADTTCFRVVVGTLAPVLAVLTPASTPADVSGLTLKLDGFGFVAGSSVLWNGSPRTTTFLNPRQLEATIPAADLVRTAGPSQSVAVRVRNPDASESADKTFTISNPLPPTFVTSPQSVAAALGASVTLTCQATGTGTISYQWKKDGVVIPGIAGTTLTLGTLQASQAGSYVVVATSAYGTATSATAVVTVGVPPSVTVSAAPAGAVLTGQTVVFTAAASGSGPLSYQWYRGNSGDTSQPIGTNSTTYSAASLATSTSFWVRVSGPVGSADSATSTVVVNPPAPVISSALTATVVGGQYFAYQITAANQPATFTATPLPAGLAFNAGTGIISGIPAAAGTYDVSLAAGNVTGTGTATLRLTVNLPAPIITSGRSVTGRAGTAFAYQIVASNSPTSYGVSSLPDGLTFNPAGGNIGGAPNAGGSGSFLIQATNAGGTGSASVAYVFEAQNPPVITTASSAAGRVGTAFSFSVQATNSPISYAAANLPPGLTLTTATGVIAGTPTAAGSYSSPVTASNVGATSAVQNLSITIAPAITVPALTSLGAASGRQGEAFTFQLAATNSPTSFGALGLPAGLTLNTGSGAITGIPTVNGTFAVQVTAGNASGTSPVRNLILTIALPRAVPVIASASLVRGGSGVFLQFDLQASNSPTRFYGFGFPAGLSLNAVSGSITGTPTVWGNISASVWAENADGGGPIQTLQFTLAAPVTAPVITLLSSEVTAFVGQPFTYTILVNNSPVSYAASNLPGGLALNVTGGVIAGTPTTVETRAVVLTATNAGGTSVPMTLSIVVKTPPTAPVISNDTLPRGRVAAAYTATITATQPPIFSYASSGLPAGLTLGVANGAMSGTPTVAGTFAVKVRATNSVGQGAEKAFSLVIDPAPTAPVISSAATFTVTQAIPARYQILASGSPTSYAATGLPDGLTLDPLTGLISGTAVTPATYSARITASNATGTSTALTLVVTVKALATVPRITTGNFQYVTVGQAFSIQLEATELPTSRPMPSGYAFVATGLPAGVSLNSATGVISGPAQTSYFYFDVYAQNEAGAGPARQLYVYLISTGNSNPVLTGPGSITATYSQQKEITIEADRYVDGASVQFFDPNGYYVESPWWTRNFNVAYTPPKITFTPSFTGRGSYQLYAYVSHTSSGWSGSSNYSGSGALRNLPLTVQAATGAPVLTIPLSASARQGQAFSLELKSSQANCDIWTTAGVPYWPGGLGISRTANGSYYLTGTPTQPGNYKISFVAQQSSGSYLRSMPTDLVLAVQAANAPAVPSAAFSASRLGELDFNLAVAGTTAGTVGVAFDYTLAASGSTERFEVSELPPGLAVNENTGRITGEPTLPGSSELTVVPYTAAGAGTPFVVQIVIAAAPGSPAVSSAATAAGQVGVAFSYQITASNSPESYGAGSLPAFLTLDAQTGLITGTPTSPGTYHLPLSASNAAGQGEALPLAFTVAAAVGTSVITSGSSSLMQAGQPSSFALAATLAPTFYGCTELPLGLSLDIATGVISGTAAQPGSYAPEVWAVNAVGEGNHVTLALTVAPATSRPAISGPGAPALKVGIPFAVQLVTSNSPTSFNSPPLPDWLSFDAYTGMLTGTPTAVGSTPLIFSANNGNGTGDDFNVTLTAVTPTAFDTWASEWFSPAEMTDLSVSGLTANGDGDDLGNLLEFAFGTDPKSATSGARSLEYNGTFAGGGTIVARGKPTLKWEVLGNGMDSRALYVRRKDFAALGLSYTIEFSPAELAPWVASITPPPTTTVLADDGQYQIVSVPYPHFVDGKETRFFRVKVILP